MIKTIKYLIIFLLIIGGLITYFFLHLHKEKNKFLFQSPGKYPQRIISLGPTITQDLFLLGVGNKIVGDTIYDVKPPQAKFIKKVGSVVEINVEKIVSLKPDIVFATSLTSPNQKEELKNLGIRVVTFSEPKNFNGICRQFLEIGKIVGEENKAENIIEKSRKEVSEIKEKIKHLPKKKVFIELGDNPLFTASGNTFINDFIKFAGGINIAQNAGSGIYSREEVIKQNPDVIIIDNMEIFFKNEKKIWEKYKTINAVKNNKIFGINQYLLSSPTPENFPKTLNKMVFFIQSEKL
ncbi:MAG: ABC transporter substrate-binding protein [Candidatus Omnitrophica bacterium]|jgi:iron complex transport system substrate-binding protein|nr:ABC transporter substrate-binding protein [Candidatus Omnitrophota bacterium]